MGAFISSISSLDLDVVASVLDVFLKNFHKLPFVGFAQSAIVYYVEEDFGGCWRASFGRYRVVLGERTFVVAVGVG